MRHLPKLTHGALAFALLLVCSSGISEQERGSNADMGNAPRVTIDRPKPTFMLRERHPRIHGLKPFQDLVDKAPAGSVLKPPPGHYAGPVIINKPLTIDGAGKVIIDAGDKGTVFELRADGAILRGLRLTGSGESHDSDDSCLDLRGHDNRIENLVIDNCLFGIDLKQSSDSIVRANKIRSKPRDLGVRGDGLRLWYSDRNLIDLRLPLERDQVAARPLHEYSADELQVLANYEGWKAPSIWDGTQLSWGDTDVTLQLHNRWPEPGSIDPSRTFSAQCQFFDSPKN